MLFASLVTVSLAGSWLAYLWRLVSKTGESWQLAAGYVAPWRLAALALSWQLFSICNTANGA